MDFSFPEAVVLVGSDFCSSICLTGASILTLEMSFLDGKQGNSSSHSQRVIVLLMIAIVAVTLACVSIWYEKFCYLNLRFHELYQNGGYKIKLKKLQNCAGPNAVVTISDNYTIVLTKNCEIKARGCSTFKTFKTAVAKITVKKSGMQMYQSTINICEKLAAASRNSTFGPMLKTFNIPEKCPVEAVSSKLFGKK